MKKDQDKKSEPIIKDSTFAGFENMIKKAKGEPIAQPAPMQHFADGGTVDPLSFLSQGFQTPIGSPAPPMQDPSMPPAPAPAPAPAMAVPPIQDVSKALSKTPDTNYDFYKNMSADDRNQLAQSLIAQQKSPGMMASNAVAGIGDAIARSYGRDSQANASGDIAKMKQEQDAAKLGAFDTGRTQKMQDVQANITAQENDPNSSLSQQTRALFQKMGIQVPSGMNHAQLKTLAPSLADLVKGQWEQSFRQAQLAQGANQFKQTNDLKKEELKESAVKTLGEHPILNMLPTATNKALKEQAGINEPEMGLPAMGQSMMHPSGAKITRVK